MTTPERIRGFIREARGEEEGAWAILADWLRDGMQTPGFLMRLYDELQPGAPFVDTAIDLAGLEEGGDLDAMKACLWEQLDDPAFTADVADSVTSAVRRALEVLLQRELKQYRAEGGGPDGPTR